MVLSTTCDFHRATGSGRTMHPPGMAVDLNRRSSVLDPIGEPPPLTPICKGPARPRAASGNARNLEVTTVICPVAHRGALPMAVPEDNAVVKDRVVVPSGSSAFTSIPARKRPLSNRRLPTALTSDRRFSPYPSPVVDVAPSTEAHPAAPLRNRCSFIPQRHLLEAESRRKWQAVQAFLRRTEDRRMLSTTSTKQNIHNVQAANMESRLLHKQLQQSPKSLVTSLSTTSQNGLAPWPHQTTNIHSGPPSPQRVEGINHTSEETNWRRLSRSSSASDLSSDDSGEYGHEVMDFSHTLQPVEVDDGFDAETARRLQSLVGDDPAVRMLPSGKHAFGCRRCQKTFVWRRHLEEHYAMHQSRDKTALCHVCGKSFTRADHLNRHSNSAHRQSTLVCQICGDVFNRASHLNRHWRSAHSQRQSRKEKPATSVGSISDVAQTTVILSKSVPQPTPVFLSTLPPPQTVPELRRDHQALLAQLFSQRRARSNETARLPAASQSPTYALSDDESTQTPPPPLSAVEWSESESDVEEVRPESDLVIDFDEEMDGDSGTD